MYTQLTCHRLGVRRGPRSTAIYVGRDVVNLLAVFIRHGLAVRRSRVRAEHNSARENHPGNSRPCFHRVLERQTRPSKHLVTRNVVEVEPTAVLIVPLEVSHPGRGCDHTTRRRE